MSSLRKLKAVVLRHNTDVDETAAILRDASIPVSAAECRGCADPCDEGHGEYPQRFDVDMETQLLGSVKPYHRQLVISTGKSDWAKEVTEAKGSLAAYLVEAQSKSTSHSKSKSPHNGAAKAKDVPGVFDPESATRTSILNGSHRTVCDDTTKETVLVFPDYKFVTEVDRSLSGAEELWKADIDPSIGRAPVARSDSTLRSWVLPYSCVIMLCSHKRRDNRCAITAPKLEQRLTDVLEREGWEVHTQLEDPSSLGPPLEELEGTDEEREAEISRRLHNPEPEYAHHKRALILRNSHIGGHKYAGNCIINFPQGVSVWYGRVTPHEVDAVVRETILGGKVLPPLLRGGANLCRPGGQDLREW